MKIKFINEWYVGEPDSYEYGKSISQAHQRVKERYYPFNVENTYWTFGSANSDGYIIDYDFRGNFIGYIARYDNIHYTYELFGPFGLTDNYNCELPTDRSEWIHFVNSKDYKSHYLGEFKTLDNIMTKVFTDCDKYLED